MFYVFSFPLAVYVGTLNLIASIPGPSILTLLNVLVFALPAEAGERIGLAITMFLAISIYMTIVSDTLSKTFHPMLKLH